MKRKNIRILFTIALAAGLAAGASSASAAGRVGQRYLEGTVDGTFWDDDAGLEDGLGGTLTYNQPLATNFDLGLGYSHLGSDLPDIDDGEGEEENDSGSVSADAFFFTGTWFAPVANGKLYFRGGLGWVNTDTPVGEDSSWAWTAETGLEIPLGKRLTVTPLIAYTDAFEGTDGAFDFGVIGNFDITSRLSLVVRASINDDSDVETRGGVLFRF